MQKGKKFLSDLKLYSDYLKWVDNEGRYETWDEAVESIINGHRKKYVDKNIENDLEFVLTHLKEKRLLASQRNLQYRFPQIEKNNARLYNCSSLYAARNKIFQEVFFLGLSGCGVGISLLTPFVDNISKIQKRVKGVKTYIIPDSIEGWANSLGVLMSSYFVDNQPFESYAGYEIKFDYSFIRPKGAFISGGFKSPGPDGLKTSLEMIETFIENWLVNNGNKLRPIAIADILCIASDAVLSGGIRRSALNMIVDPNDQEMINAKIGNWREKYPYRARSNNSVLLLRNEVNKEQFDKIISLNDGISDIGYVFANSWFDLFNPCFTGDMELLTSEGYKKFSELSGQTKIELVNAVGQKVLGSVRQTGYKDVVEIKLTTGKTIKCTPDHLLIDIDGNEVEAINSKGVRIAHYLNHNKEFDELYTKLGFIQGDGVLSRLESLTHKGLEVCFNPKDFEVANMFDIECTTSVYINGYNDILKELKFSSSSLPERTLPKTFYEWTDLEKKSFLRGLFSANGSVLRAGRVTLKSTCKSLIEELVNILTNFGVSVYYTTNKESFTEFKNGVYKCKESYDLNFASYESLVWFYNNIGFVQSYKNNILLEILKYKAPKVRVVKPLSKKEVVYDFELGDLLHVGSVNGLLVHNCYEILKHPILYKKINKRIDTVKYNELYSFTEENRDKLGVSFCNLVEINAEKATNKEEFYDVCRAASILGTLQAGYTNFPYLGKTTEEIVKQDALLGVSITGILNNPILLNKELLNVGASIVKTTNKRVAKLIKINQAARTTCIKPSGNSSVILGTASGIHPEHSEKYFRIMQLNKETETAKWLEKNMPSLLEESYWSSTRSDYAVFIPIENPKTGLFKKDVKGVKHLEIIKLVQENWVNEGTNRELCAYPNVNHNVSNTVIIDNKEEVVNYIWENKESFTANSFISDYGDKEFIQAPFTSVSSLEEIVSIYGKGAIFASGLIVDGLHYFNNDLWTACDSVKDKTLILTGTREQVLLKKYWLTRVKKFAHNFFSDDIQKTIYCLKDIHLLHKWDVINRETFNVDFGKILVKPEYKEVSKYSAVACSGGACEITRF